MKFRVIQLTSTDLFKGCFRYICLINRSPKSMVINRFVGICWVSLNGHVRPIRSFVWISHPDTSSLPSRWLGESNESTLPATPTKMKTETYPPTKSSLFQYQTTDLWFLRKHLFNGDLVGRNHPTNKSQAAGNCWQWWFGLVSSRLEDATYILWAAVDPLCTREVEVNVSRSRKKSQKWYKPAIFFVRCVCCFLETCVVLEVSFLSSCFFSWYNFVRLVGSFHEIEHEMGMTSYVLNMLNLPHIPNIPIWKASWLTLRTTFRDDDCEVQKLIWGSFRSVR